MTKYVALLRGINVGGKIVKMDELKKILTAMRFKNVKTLLASGNIVFDTDKNESEKLEKTISEKLEKHFGFTIFVLLRTIGDIQKLIAKNPFQGIAVKPETRLYVTFLTEKPNSKLHIPYENPEKDLKILSVTDSEACTVITISTDRNTTDMMGLLEKEFGKKVTTRNWNTVQKLAKL